jgi:hypothetical protein
VWAWRSKGSYLRTTSCSTAHVPASQRAASVLKGAFSGSKYVERRAAHSFTRTATLGRVDVEAAATAAKVCSHRALGSSGGH